MTKTETTITFPPLPVIADIVIRQHPQFSDYAVGDDGSVWSCKRTGRGWQQPAIVWKQRRPILDPQGRLQVTLCPDNKRRIARKIHRLVLETFVGSAPRGCECRHLNGDKRDNRLSNLQWGTHSENAIDSVRHGTTNTLKLTEEQVRLIRSSANKGNHCRLAAMFGVSQSMITRIANHKTWKHVA